MPAFLIRYDAIDTDSLHHCQVGSLLCKYSGDNRQNTGEDQNGKRLCWNSLAGLSSGQSTAEAFSSALENIKTNLYETFGGKKLKKPSRFNFLYGK